MKKRMLSFSSKVLIFLLFIPLIVFTTNIFTETENIPEFKSVVIDPLDVQPGDEQTFTVQVNSPNKIDSIISETQLDNELLILPLEKISEDNEGETYSITWTAKDVHARTYQTTFIARDSEGNENSITSTWTDSCEGIIQGQNSVLASNCTVSEIYGLDSGDLTIGTGKKLTIDGVVFVMTPGYSVIMDGGSFSPINGGSLTSGYLFADDNDGDSYSDGTYSWDASNESAYPLRAKDALGFSDCNDGDADIYRNIVNLARDADNDGYKSTIEGVGTKCVGDDTQISGRTYYDDAVGDPFYFANSSSLGDDCSDSKSAGHELIHPGQTAWFSTPVGSWWDYDCSSVNEKRWTTVNGDYASCNEEEPPCTESSAGTTGWELGSSPSCGASTNYVVSGDCGEIDEFTCGPVGGSTSSKTQECH